MRNTKISVLDRERELSMADEGGFSAAINEGINSLEFSRKVPSSLATQAFRLLSDPKIWIAASAVVIGAGVFAKMSKKYPKNILR